MYIEIHNNLGRPQRIDVTRVVVYDAFGNPVSLALEVAPNTILTETLENNPSAFHEILQQLGINKTVIVQDVPQVNLRQIRFTE